MNINKKTLFIIISSLAILILALVIYLFVFQKNALFKNSPLSNSNKAADNKQAEAAKEKVAYDNYQKNLAVVYAKNIDLCQTLVEDDEINECLDAIAVQANRKDYCERIKNDDKLKTQCLDSIDFMNISWGANPNLCDTLADAALKENCYEEYFSKLNNLSQCEIVKDPARQKHCQDIVDNRLKSLTAAKAAIKDSDHDGLPDDVEISYGTNPFKADTDGDGVSDYEEINTYHTNPRIFNPAVDFKK
jgi:hypothetical protein